MSVKTVMTLMTGRMRGRVGRQIALTGILVGHFAAVGMLLGCDSTDREAALAQVGAELGLAYEASLASALATQMGAMPSMSIGGQNYFVRALGSDDLLVFDWTWREGPLKERNRESQTVVAIRLGSGLPILPFVWVERGRLEGADRRRFGDPIEWSDVARFTDAYQVVGANRAALRAVFTREARARLALPSGLRVEGAGSWLIGWRPGTRLDPAEISARIDEMREIAALFQGRPGSTGRARPGPDS